MTSEKIAGSTPLAWQTAAAIFVQAMAVSGVCEDGFHRVASPQATASAEFQAHTATGKLNAEMTPTAAPSSERQKIAAGGIRLDRKGVLSLQLLGGKQMEAVKLNRHDLSLRVDGARRDIQLVFSVMF